MKRLVIAILMLTAVTTMAADTGASQPPATGGNASVTPTTRPASDRQSSNRRRRNRRSETTDDSSIGSSTANPIPLSAEFDVLTERSIFTKGRRSSSSSGGGDSGPARPEDTLVFNGVTQSDHQSVAFIEDTSTQKVQVMQVGQSIADGKIVKITLDGLDFKSSQGNTVHVLVGQNLRGRDAWNLIYGLGSETPSDSTAVAETPSDPATAALIAKMKQKRLQEMNGGVAPSPTTAPSGGR